MQLTHRLSASLKALCQDTLEFSLQFLTSGWSWFCATLNLRRELGSQGVCEALG